MLSALGINGTSPWPEPSATHHRLLVPPPTARISPGCRPRRLRHHQTARCGLCRRTSRARRRLREVSLVFLLRQFLSIFQHLCCFLRNVHAYILCWFHHLVLPVLYGGNSGQNMGTWCWLAGGEGGNTVFDPLLRTTGGTIPLPGSRPSPIALGFLHPCVLPDPQPVFVLPHPSPFVPWHVTQARERPTKSGPTQSRLMSANPACMHIFPAADDSPWKFPLGQPLHSHGPSHKVVASTQLNL